MDYFVEITSYALYFFMLSKFLSTKLTNRVRRHVQHIVFYKKCLGACCTLNFHCIWFGFESVIIESKI